jgi:hypothetical protein
VIEEGLLLVKNELFRTRFRDRFDWEYLHDQKSDLFKEINNPVNPLYQLIQIDKKGNINSLLLLDLTELICHKIEIIKNELLEDTFRHPTQTTFIYAVLKEKFFENLSIRKEIIQHLTSLWEEWEQEGFQISQINSWNELKDEQRQIACQIWNLIGESLGKPIQLEQLINEAKEKIKDIVKTIENVASCINNYCQDACDRNHYLTHLQDIRDQLNQATIYSAKISQEIELLKPFADRLEPVIPSCVWQKYLKQNVEAKSKLICLQMCS